MLRRFAYWSWVLVLFLPGLVGATETEEAATVSQDVETTQQVETVCPQLTPAQEVSSDSVPVVPLFALSWQTEAERVDIDQNSDVLSSAEMMLMAPGRCRLTCHFCWTSNDCPKVNGWVQPCEGSCL